MKSVGKASASPPPECCSPASLGLGALHPALAEPNARALICALPCHGATLFGCFSAKCLQPKLALLMVFGLLWLLAYSGLELRRAPRLLMSDSETAIAVVREACLHPRPGVYPMSGIICSQGGHLISGQMAKAFSSA